MTRLCATNWLGILGVIIALLVAGTGPTQAYGQNSGAQTNGGLTHEEGKAAFEAGKFDQARKIWIPLADAGDASSQFSLALLYKNALGVKRDDSKAAFWFERAAEKGMTDAQKMIGLLYFSGTGVPRSLDKSARFYEMAAQSGDAEAQYMLANLYRQGKGVELNFEQAARWYEAAAKQGDIAAQSNLARLYMEGVGV
ncbi:MAG: tetratricopeptide repeat protein, partial [Pseudomonadota bacterium]|nr:tetratricopeptide repeat protein [Pseudomonadota bacterium]